MINTIIGQVDWPSAFIVIAFMAAIVISFGIYRTSQPPTQDEIDLRNKHEDNEHNRYMFERETYRQTQLKAIEAKQITAYRSEIDE